LACGFDGMMDIKTDECMEWDVRELGEGKDSSRRLFRLSASTQSFLNEAKRMRGYNLGDFIHGYIYARWPYLYIGIGTGEHWVARIFQPILGLFSHLIPPRSKSEDEITFADTYHGKVVTTSAARQLVLVQEEIRLHELEKIIPYRIARDIILQNPDHIVVLECPCRASRPNPCLPLDVCLIIGEPFASFILEHHPRRSRPIIQAEAARILEEEHARGHVHHAFFKQAMLGRFYAICNCCSCCCGAMQAWRNGTPMLASSGYVSQIDDALCIACGICVEACPFGALDMGEESVLVSQERCMGCGICVSSCEQGALSLLRDAKKGEPLELLELLDS
jgi:NAD-dependent dihydropyrimidine dehydrogenase PreA subunit